MQMKVPVRPTPALCACNADNKIRKLIKYNYEIANDDIIP